MRPSRGCHGLAPETPGGRGTRTELFQVEHLCSNWSMSRPLQVVPDAAQDTARSAILRSAAALLAVDSGASLAQIAAAAGLGRTTVHRAFPTRADLLTALALQSVGHLQAALDRARLDDGPATEVLGRIVEQVLPLAAELRFLDAGPEVWKLPELLDAWWSVTASLDAVVERGQREGDIRADIPAELVVEAFTGMLSGVWQGIRDGRIARMTATRHLVTLALSGLRSPGAGPT